jgi:thioredoxin-like negative regulator of GroEL
MIDAPVHVTDAAFEQTVLQSKQPVIVDFGRHGAAPAKWSPQSWTNSPRNMPEKYW